MTIPSQKKQVEQLAKELYTMYWRGEADKFMWPNMPSTIREDWKNMAKHVLGLIIQANIAQLKIVKNIPGQNLYIIDTIKELEEQLQSLNPPEGEIDG